MTADTLFMYGNMLAMAGWVLLAVTPIWKFAERIAGGLVVTLLALAYAALIVRFFNLGDMARFGSLRGVKSLFSNDYMLLAGWVHYLAFDLFVGCWILRNSRKHHVPHVLFLVCGALTFMLGPCGLLLYVLIRTVWTKRLAEVLAND